MFPPRPAPDRDLILAHAPYVRSLARRLVFDAELAKDLEQEVLLAALENAPRDPHSIKGWLASILRHLASKAFRSGERRAAREAASASPAVPTPDEILAREDQRRALVEHVLALEESLRDVLVLRYFEDLPPRAVARRLGMPVETVRTRAKRGLELVRARLEREGGKGKGTWCLALVSALRLEPPSLALAGASIAAASLPGVVAMSLSKKIALAVVVLASATWITLKSGIPASPSRALVSAAPEASALRAPASEATAEAPAEPARTAIAGSPLALPVTQAAPTADTGSVLLSVLWFDGTPAAGVRARVYHGGSYEYGDSLEVTTGADGTRQIEAVLPGRVLLAFDRGPAEVCEVRAGSRTDLVVTFPRGFDISGRVIERDGRAVAGADVILDQNSDGWTGHVMTRSDESGRFEIRSVSDGLLWLSAHAPMRTPSPQREIVGHSTNMENVELVLEPVGAALEGIVFGGDGQPLPGARVLVGPEEAFFVVYFDDGGRGRTAAAQAAVCDEQGHFSVPGVPIGRLPLLAIGAGHSSWTGEVETLAQRTAHVEIRLEPCTSLSGRLTDSAGNPIALAEVHGDLDAEFARRSAITAADGTFTMTDLPNREFRVSVEAKGFEEVQTVLMGSAGAALTWSPVMGSGRSIRGRLVMPGTDFSKWSIACETQDWARSPFRADVHPSADGAFEIMGCAAEVPHSIDVRVPDAPWAFPVASRRDVLPGGPAVMFQLDPSCVPSCAMHGRIVDDLNEPVPGINFFIAREGRNIAASLFADDRGEFDLRSYSPGRYRVDVHAAGFADYSGGFVDLLEGSTHDFGDIQLQRGGTIAVRLVRDPALTQAEINVSAIPVGTSESSWLSTQGEVARSEALLPGEYVVRLRGIRAEDLVAQRTARITVRAGEEATAELHVESGVLLKLAWSPEDVTGADVQLFDVAGALVCEDRLGRYDAITVPRSAVRLRARSDDGRSADVALVQVMGAAEQSVPVELK